MEQQLKELDRKKDGFEHDLKNLEDEQKKYETKEIQNLRLKYK